MSVKASSSRFAIDAPTILRAAGQPPLHTTSKTITNPADVGYLTLDTLSSYWAMGDTAGLLSFGLYCTVETITQISGTANITFSAVIDTDPTFAIPTPLWITTDEKVNAPCVTVLEVNQETINNAIAALGGPFTVATPVYLCVIGTIAGGASSPQVAWNAYAAPLAGV